MNFRQSRWLSLAIFCIINLFAGSLYVWSVFSGPIAARLSEANGISITPADLGTIFSIASAVNPAAMILGGWVNDRFGPRAVIPAGGLMIGAGLVLSSSASSISELMICYGAVFGFGVGLTYTSTISSAIKFFPDRRGLAGGLASMSYGLSAIILPPIASTMIASVGIEETLLILGFAAASVIALGGMLSRKCPENVTELVGAREPAHALHAQPGTLRVRAPQDKNWREMLSSPIFWAMLAFFVTGSTGAMMLISSAATVAQIQIGASASAAAAAVSLIAVMNASGRILAGSASDRFGRMPTLFLCLLSASGGLLLLLSAGTESWLPFLAGISLVALCYGGFVGIYPGFTVEQFGAKHNSVNYGIMAAGFSAGGILGPWLLRAFSHGDDFSQAYWAALAVCAAGFVFGGLCLKLIRDQRTALSLNAAPQASAS